MLRFKFFPKFFLIIFLAFILFTIIGTLSHELGHIAVAKYFGYETTLDYGSMAYSKDFSNDEDVKKIKKISKEYIDSDYEEWPEDVKLKVEDLDEIIMSKYPYNETYKFQDLGIAIGGPAQTLFTSFVGLLILFLRRNKQNNGFNMFDWLAVFMSLFALREVFNFLQAFYSFMFYSQSNFSGDEFEISRLIGFNEWIVPSLTLVLGVLISCYVIFKVIPLKYRFTFILSGLCGGILGFTLWFEFLGEILFN